MATLADVPEFFSRPLGADYPKELDEQLKRTRACTIKIEGSAKYISATVRIRLDSQQPWLDVKFDKTHVVFPATRAAFKLVLKGDSRETDNIIKTHQNSTPQLKKDYQACFFQLSLSADPVFAGPFWKLNKDLSARWKSLHAVKWNGKTAAIWIEIPNKCLGEFRTMQTHIARLVELVRTNLRPNNPQCGLWYAERNPLPEGVKAPRRPKAPWLFDQDGNYHTWDSPLNFFLDEQDRRSRLVEAAIIEQHIEWATYDEVFCDEKTHDVIFERAGPTEAYWQLHVWMNADPKPNPPEGIKANYKVNTAGPGESSTGRVVTGDGICIQSSRADFAILTRAHFGSAMDGQMRKIKATVTVNLKFTTLQIDALDLAGRIVTFGDSDTTEGHGYSLKRTILAHGSELSPGSELYFELDVREVSVLDQKLKDERLEYIQKKFKLDDSQREAVSKSVFHVVAGIHLVKGPPGNGKTRTTLVMILILACLGMKVLISAGSNQAVDTLLLAYHEALKEDKRLQGWCGGYCRFRTPAYQMAVLRRSSKSRQLGGQTSRKSSVEAALADCQIEALVVQMATDSYDREPEAKKLLNMLDEDRQRILSKEEILVLTRCYEGMLRCALRRCKVVAATLNASGDTNFQLAFEPYALFCDEAGQCLEGDSMIPMTTFLSLRTIILIGDPEQLPPTVLSKGENEGANYQGKSLMSRLSDLYPLTLLEINYRCHPQILDWPASAIYKDKITASEQNVMADRVGNAWDAFVSSLYHFKRAGLIGKRRLVIDANGKAEQPSGSTSWCNDEHISVVITFLRALYADRSSNDRISPSDVVLICPYKEQVKRVNQRFAQEGVKYDRCLTIDGSQGQEANVIIFMFTKPRTSDKSEVGFLASYHRLNVALTRAKKLLIVVANLGIWNKRWAGAAKNGSTRYLGSFLTDVFAKNDILKWEGAKTVTERVDGTQKPKAIVSLPASSMRKAPSVPQSAAPPRKASPVTRPPASPRNVEQSGAVGVAPDSKVIGGEVVKITSSLEQLKLDREALEAEQVAMNERWAMLDAMLAKWNAEQDDLRARWARVDAAIANLEGERP